ncbi:hypothetical protein SAMN02949497_3744 [Methylomagnum ishizawai]|uniref:Cytochrome c domain-containing protein n=1 Tax=Methylomagnum ishizawai TaxID=1760988 RepID=A0A1Y6D081_9GAMM|nr:hypothetical protein [Methylomagnum ishizawai]SMF96349.1 hypothetical protein SAMN02949497_3744 [Methylomagnum ishizawai]
MKKVLPLALGLLGVLAIDQAAATAGCPVPLDRSEAGLAMAPVTLNLGMKGINPRRVGYGSYLVNAVSGCNDCHTNPPYASGGDPFQGQPEQINTTGYLAGGTAFGPFVSRNLTPCGKNGHPEWTFEQFKDIMRNGTDMHDPTGPKLQVMPWPVYSKMADCDLLAIYQYLKAIPPICPAE